MEPYPHSKKNKQSESGFQLFLKENSEAVHSELPNVNNITKINYLNKKYNQLPASEQQLYASRAAAQNQIQAAQSKKKKGLTRSGDGSPNNTPYISQNNTSNYSPQESQHYSNLPSIQINQYNQQSSHHQIPNSARQYISSNYQTIPSNLPTSIPAIQTKTSQIQPVTPKKRITKPIKKKQESESSESDDESDSTYISNPSQQRRNKMPSVYTKQSQNQNQNQLTQPSFYYSQPQINQNYSAQQSQKAKQKITKTTTSLPTPYQQNQNISMQDHRLQYEQNEPKLYININPKPVQAPSNNESYSNMQTNQMNTQRQLDSKFYRDIEKTLDESTTDPSKEEEMVHNLLNEFELKSNFYFSMMPSDCNCLENYPTSFIGK